MPNAIYDDPAKVEAWLTRRRSCVGSSDAAAVAGLSPYATALSVWVDKVQPSAASPMSDAQEMGLIMEPAIARAYERRFKVDLVEPTKELPLIHPKYPFMGASPDRLRPDGGTVQLKNVNARMSHLWGEDGTDEVPEFYALQVQQEMAVLGTDRGEIPALFGGCELRVYPIPRNEKLIANLIEIEAAFWDHVLTRTAPPPDWNHPTTAALIAAMYPPREGEEISLGDDALPLVEEYERLGDQEKSAEKARKAAKAKLIEKMGTAACAFLPDGRFITRKRQEIKAHEVKAHEKFPFLIRAARRRSTVGAS